MLKLSFWAKNHPIAARWGIAANRLIMGCLGFAGGFLLAGDALNFSKMVFAVSAAMFLAGFAGYPKQQSAGGLKNFRRRKFCDALLVASSLLFWVGAGNWLPEWSLAPEPAATRIVEPASPLALAAMDHAWLKETAVKSSPEFFKKAEKKQAGFFKKLKSWREGFFQKMKSKIRRDVVEWRSAAKGSGAGKIVLLVLASLAIIILLGYITVVVSCNLSCNGQEGAASVVVILGLAAIIGSIAWMWTAATRKERKKRQSQIPSGNPHLATEPPLPYESTLQVTNPALQVCLSAESRATVTVWYDGRILAKNVKIGDVPRCFEIEAKGGKLNGLTIETHTGASGGKMKLVTQDGAMKRTLDLPMTLERATSVDFQLKS